MAGKVPRRLCNTTRDRRCCTKSLKNSKVASVSSQGFLKKPYAEYAEILRPLFTECSFVCPKKNSTSAAEFCVNSPCADTASSPVFCFSKHSESRLCAFPGRFEDLGSVPLPLLFERDFSRRRQVKTTSPRLRVSCVPVGIQTEIGAAYETQMTNDNIHKSLSVPNLFCS